MANAAAISLDRMVGAADRVQQRLARVVTALETAGSPYAVIGDQAVAAWVRTVDENAVRNSSEIEVLLSRADFDKTRVALERIGFVCRHIASLGVVLDGPESSLRDAVHIVFAGEKVRGHGSATNPELSASSRGDGFRVLTLEPLVQIKLTEYRDKDRTHLRDLIEVGLVDESWVAKLPEELGKRLQALLDEPLG